MLESHMSPGQTILVRLPSQNIKIVKLEAGSTISLGKFGQFPADLLFGDPFGFTYQIEADEKLSVVKETYDEEGSAESLGAEQTMTGHKIGASGLQNLSMDEIEALKKQGVSGEEIISRMTSSHEAFEHKTEYSKEKYLKRKKQKFLKRFTPLAINSSELIDIYLDKDPHKINNVSAETLALLLNNGNVRPGGNYLVNDETPGVLVAAVLERMGGEGTITVVHENEHPNLDCLRYLNLTEAEQNQIKTVTWLDLLHPEETGDLVEKTEEELAGLKPAHRRQYFRHKARVEERKLIQSIASQGFDGLFTMSKLDPASYVPAVVHLVKGGKPIVVYYEGKEVLVKLSLAVKNDTRILAPTILETRVRIYQTLPGRIHPLMTSRGYGGYIWSALRVHPGENINAMGKRSIKKRKAEAPLEQPPAKQPEVEV